jgi:hypothetical protein
MNFNKTVLASVGLFIILMMTNLFGCCFYSFTGAAVPSHLNSVAIPVVDDRSGAGEPGLRELITEQLTQKFLEDNTFQVTDRTTSDALLECIITSLSDAPAVVAPGETVAVRRITISVSVAYKDQLQRRTIYERAFSNFGDYPSGGGLAERAAAIETAVDRITEDILLETVSGW